MTQQLVAQHLHKVLRSSHQDLESLLRKERVAAVAGFRQWAHFVEDVASGFVLGAQVERPTLQ